MDLQRIDSLATAKDIALFISNQPIRKLAKR